MTANAHDHAVEIDEKKRTLTIYRLIGSTRQHYTSVRLPQRSATDDPAGFNEFCRLLGENILIDSPQARRALQL
jgi:hypothetical protein